MGARNTKEGYSNLPKLTLRLAVSTDNNGHKDAGHNQGAPVCANESPGIQYGEDQNEQEDLICKSPHGSGVYIMRDKARASERILGFQIATTTANSSPGFALKPWG